MEVTPHPSSNFSLAGMTKVVSRLGLGGAPTGGHGWGVRDDEAAEGAIRTAFENGINFFDTADVYGLGVAERILAKVMASTPGMRAGSLLATKGGVAWDTTGRTRRDSSPAYLRAALEFSLRRLQTDCVDLYYLHWPDGNTALEDSIGALVELRAQGKTRAIGICNVSAPELQKLNWAGISAIQVKGNLLEPLEMVSAARVARDLGAAVVCSSALADGLLSGAIGAETRFGADDHRSRYPLFQRPKFAQALEHVAHLVELAQEIAEPPASVALRWLLQCGYADAVLIGSTSSRHIRENCRCLRFSIADSQMAELRKRVPVERLDDSTEIGDDELNQGGAILPPEESP
jgi:myo-inositol catabolism protein IolS